MLESFLEVLMASDISNYKCPACGGGLKFNPQKGKVICEYCDSVYSIEEIEQFGKKQIYMLYDYIFVISIILLTVVDKCVGEVTNNGIN